MKPRKINENQKVTLTFEQLKRLVKESEVSAYVYDNDADSIRALGDILADIFLDCLKNKNINLLNKLHRVMQNIDALIATNASDPMDPRLADAIHAIDAVRDDIENDIND